MPHRICLMVIHSDCLSSYHLTLKWVVNDSHNHLPSPFSAALCDDKQHKFHVFYPQNKY